MNLQELNEEDYNNFLSFCEINDLDPNYCLEQEIEDEE